MTIEPSAGNHTDPWWVCAGCWAQILAMLVALFTFFNLVADILRGTL